MLPPGEYTITESPGLSTINSSLPLSLKPSPVFPMLVMVDWVTTLCTVMFPPFDTVKFTKCIVCLPDQLLHAHLCTLYKDLPPEVLQEEEKQLLLNQRQLLPKVAAQVK